ncbi:MAG: hypothetical protein A2007_02305 [Verrucomicrobia bacterium GWC2_42_7]|nr:MAG: hypothetical protein A2007_02305 [Verrucomicrobia bacterium GWC2_42_7]
MDDQFLLDFYTQHERHAWIGTEPSFEMDVIDLKKCTNFRVNPQLHQQYDAVWFWQEALHEQHTFSWRIMLDECIRLLKKDGYLIVRTRQSNQITIPMIKSFLWRNPNLKVSVFYEKCASAGFQLGEFNIIFQIERLHFECYQSKLWTFSMLTGGQRDENVVRFLKSIRDKDPEFKHEILISGPQKELYAPYAVKYVDTSSIRENYAEIARKKNLIAAAATHPNLMIAHDRYWLSDTFFKDFEKYGYDFDFLAVKQLWDDGDEYPYYCFVYNNDLTWSYPVKSDNYQYLFNYYQYVNGGFTVVKTHSLKKIKFNDLLFWEQMEDVELTQEFLKHSIIPRVNYLAHAVTAFDGTKRSQGFKMFDLFDGLKIWNFVQHANIGKLNNPLGLNKRNYIKKWVLKFTSRVIPMLNKLEQKWRSKPN